MQPKIIVNQNMLRMCIKGKKQLRQLKTKIISNTRNVFKQKRKKKIVTNQNM